MHRVDEVCRFAGAVTQDGLQRLSRLSRLSRLPGCSASSTSRLLLWLLAAVLVLLLLRYYAKTPAQTRVLQVRVPSFSPDLLMEKQPIVVEDRVCDPRELARVALRFYYVHLRCRPAVKLPTGEGPPLCTRGAATLISPIRGARPARVHVIRASNTRSSSAPPIDFRLRACQVLVLPPHWEVRSAGSCGAVSVVEAFDILHAVLLPVSMSGILDARRKNTSKK